MYDPHIGRWLEEDPMGFAAGDPNLYRYVKNNPTKFTDPSGLQGAGIYPNNWVRRMYLDDDSDEFRRGANSAIGDSYLGVGCLIGGALGLSQVGALLAAGRATAAAAVTARVIGTRALVAPGLGAGTWPALIVGGRVYIARFHNIAWEAAGRGTVQAYGMAVIDAAGRVIRWGN